MIDLNSTEFDVKDVKIFNDGNAGIAEPCTYEVVPKSSEDKENAPDWRVVFKDESGATVNKAFWIQDESHPKFTEMLRYQGAELKHLVQAVMGESKLPPFKNAEEMLNNIMSQLSKYNNKVSVRVLVNYGIEGKKEESYVSVSPYAPYVESLDVPIEKTSLRQPKNAILERPKPDSESDSPFKGDDDSDVGVEGWA